MSRGPIFQIILHLQNILLSYKVDFKAPRGQYLVNPTGLVGIANASVYKTETFFYLYVYNVSSRTRVRCYIGSASRARFEQHLVTARAVSRAIRPQRWPRPRVASFFQNTWAHAFGCQRCSKRCFAQQNQWNHTATSRPREIHLILCHA